MVVVAGSSGSVLSNAERQANKWKAAMAVTRPRRPTGRRSRPQRWRDAVGTLFTLQTEYADWLAALSIASKAARQPRRSQPSSISTWRPSLTLSHHAVTGVIEPTIDPPDG
jgi:hypothetical protein